MECGRKCRSCIYCQFILNKEFSDSLIYFNHSGQSMVMKMFPRTMPFTNSIFNVLLHPITLMWHILTNSSQFWFLAFSIVALPHKASHCHNFGIFRIMELIKSWPCHITNIQIFQIRELIISWPCFLLYSKSQHPLLLLPHTSWDSQKFCSMLELRCN